ncbi:MAG: elongation factor 4 [Deltaproteobacteria bacterium]|nr:elongation factor 4 [Deltaproteobacteria bacterium]
MNPELIRNFSIVAHIDHGKSTLSDRLIEKTGTLPPDKIQAQMLDSMDIERERGITIKAQTVRMAYTAKDNKTYQLNLIDTPGHVDFSYEVSRSLAACEGAVLVVDATQGVQAQTIANAYLAINNNLEIIPVLNKVDLKTSDPVKTALDIEEVIGIDASHAILASAKTGQGVEEILEAIVKKVPPPKGSASNPLKALLIDSWFDTFLGVICVIRVFEGTLKKGTFVQLMSNKKSFEVQTLGIFSPKPKEIGSLNAGEVGFFSAAIKDVRDTKIGDTITEQNHPTQTPFPGFKEVKPMVFSGFFPTENNGYELLKDALEKLRLNDASFTYEADSSTALGFGFRCGFLGLLHMEIVKERLERHFSLSLVTTAPSVIYKIKMNDGSTLVIDNPANLPSPSLYQETHEPYIKASIHTPSNYTGDVMKLCEERRGHQIKMEYLSPQHLLLEYEMPLNEMVFDFYDKLKTISRGYHKEKAYYRGRELAKKLKTVIHRQMFEVAIQAAIGSRVIARETVGAMRKDVTAKCYGGDISRKRKLLEKQKEGKKKMKMIGRVELPQEAFLAVLKID